VRFDLIFFTAYAVVTWLLLRYVLDVNTAASALVAVLGTLLGAVLSAILDRIVQRRAARRNPEAGGEK
jgi:membrane protein YqaA with SNARE-associated domain